MDMASGITTAIVQICAGFWYQMKNYKTEFLINYLNP